MQKTIRLSGWLVLTASAGLLLSLFGHVVAFGGDLGALPLSNVVAAPNLAGWDQADWRTAKNDGINCLYLQLRAMGGTLTYEEFRQKLPQGSGDLTLQTLGQLATQFGYHLAPAMLTVSDLANSPMPVLIYTEASGLASGQFCLVLGAYEKEVRILVGNSMTLKQLPPDEFRRTWTGYALVPAYRMSVTDLSMTILSAAVLSVAAIVIIKVWKIRMKI